MKKIALILSLFLASAVYAVSQNVAAASLLEEISADPEKSGGIYYAYPVKADSLAPVPDGFEPYYISHYGRHGSRWVINMGIYPKLLSVLAQQDSLGNLTPLGSEISGLLEICADHAQGHSGELSPLGEDQHRAIATRMVERFPSVFDDSASIVMRSSTEPRCIVSMAAFSEAVKAMRPNISVERHATPGDMDTIHYTSLQAKALGDEGGQWMRGFQPVRDKLTRCESSASLIFNDINKVDNLPLFMRYLHDAAIDVQDVVGLPESCNRLIEVFTPEDLYSLWMASNYMMYVKNADTAPSRDLGPQCAAHLLENIMKHASASESSADLRFGHDTSLIRLLALMGIEGCSPAGASSPQEAAGQWQTFRISPMGANLQLIFLRDTGGREIVGIRLNEMPAGVEGLEEAFPGYYDRAKLFEFWRKKIK